MAKAKEDVAPAAEQPVEVPVVEQTAPVKKPVTPKGNSVKLSETMTITHY